MIALKLNAEINGGTLSNVTILHYRTLLQRVLRADIGSQILHIVMNSKRDKVLNHDFLYISAFNVNFIN